MTVFELMLYACLTTGQPDFSNSSGLSFTGRHSKTCDWQISGRLFTSSEKCRVAGDPLIGSSVLADTVYAGTTYIYEKVGCVSRDVED